MITISNQGIKYTGKHNTESLCVDIESPDPPISPEAQAAIDRAVSLSKTPEWQQALLLINEKYNKKPKRNKKAKKIKLSQIGNKSHKGRVG